MNSFSKGKLILYLLVLFAAGGATGYMIGARSAKQTLFKPPRWDEIVAAEREQMRTRLNLTPEQATRVSNILARSSSEIRSAFETQGQRIRQVIDNRNTEILALLTPDQKTRFQQMEKEREEKFRNRDAHRKRAGGGRDPHRQSSQDLRTNDSEHPLSSPKEVPSLIEKTNKPAEN